MLRAWATARAMPRFCSFKCASVAHRPILVPARLAAGGVRMLNPGALCVERQCSAPPPLCALTRGRTPFSKAVTCRKTGVTAFTFVRLLCSASDRQNRQAEVDTSHRLQVVCLQAGTAAHARTARRQCLLVVSCLSTGCLLVGKRAEGPEV